MKKRILLFTAIAAMATGILTSGKNGAGAEKGYDCTGAETGLGNFAGCGGAGGCHNSSLSTGITVLLELDSAGVATTHYKGGMTYTVKITGTNTTASSLPVFGFQVTCVKGTTAVTTPVNAGTFASTGLPGDVQYTPAQLPSDFAVNMVEHKFPIPATTGGGATGSTYIESFQWTAPTAGTGTVSFWGVVNACTGDTAHSSNSDLSNNTHINISEWTTTTSVSNANTETSIIAFPNPIGNELNLQMNNAVPGTYSFEVFDVMGKSVANGNLDVNGMSDKTTINTSGWAYGTYNVVIEKEGVRQVTRVVKL